MVKILMMSAKMATPALLKIKVFEINVIKSYTLSRTSPTKFCHITQIIMWMWSCDQNLVTLAFLQEKLS